MPATLNPVQPTELIERLAVEGPIGLTAASRILKRHPSTLARWCIDGVRLPDGTAVKLESYRLGGKLSTSRPAILRFVAAQQTETPPAPIQTPAARRRADAQAERILDAAGIK